MKTKTVTTEITQRQMINFKKHVPFHLQIRSLLFKAGFKFEFDDLYDVMQHDNPKILGVLKRWDDPKTYSCHFKQIYIVE